MAIIALEIKARQTLAGGREFGAVGAYLQLDGTAHFAIDPRHPGNRCIADVDLRRVMAMAASGSLQICGS